MPPAVAIGALGLAGMVDQNLQNKAAIKNKEDAQSAAQQQVAQNKQSALGALNAYTQPSAPTAAATTGQPRYSGASVPLASLAPPQSSSGISPQQAQQLMQYLQQLPRGAA